MHCNFGIDLINQIKAENPIFGRPTFKAEVRDLFEKAVALEYRLCRRHHAARACSA